MIRRQNVGPRAIRGRSRGAEVWRAAQEIDAQSVPALEGEVCDRDHREDHLVPSSALSPTRRRHHHHRCHAGAAARTRYDSSYLTCLRCSARRTHRVPRQSLHEASQVPQLRCHQKAGSRNALRAQLGRFPAKLHSVHIPIESIRGSLPRSRRFRRRHRRETFPLPERRGTRVLAPRPASSQVSTFPLFEPIDWAGSTTPRCGSASTCSPPCATC